MPLIDPAVRNAKPKEKAYKLPDEKGMYLLVGGVQHQGKRLPLDCGGALQQGDDVYPFCWNSRRI
jgi:hypothetical protein